MDWENPSLTLPARIDGHTTYTGRRTMVPDAARAELIQLARAASQRAYCPYSHFPVGAAIVCADGRLFAACNVENASYGLTMCAERNAIFQAIAAGAQHVRAIVIYTPTATPSAPCGACRQVLNEFGPDMIVLSVCDGPDSVAFRLTDLLPQAFGPHNLGKPPAS
jgi:cytidine deaminase